MFRADPLRLGDFQKRRGGARGVYSLADASPDVGHDLARAARQVPGGVVCLLSALRFHRLTSQNPFEVWVAIPPNAWRPVGGGVPIRFVHVARPHLADGVEHHRIEGTNVAITTPAKTVAGCFEFRNRIGTDVAIEALREFVQRHPGKIDSLLRHAKVDRLERVIHPHERACTAFGPRPDHQGVSSDRYHSDMSNIRPHELAHDAAALLDRVEAGERIVVIRGGRPVAELRPVDPPHGASRPFGLAAGTFTVPDDFDGPLPPEVSREF